MGKTIKKVCNCEVYDFPHRPESGRCYGDLTYEPAKIQQTRRARLTPDEIADDPRRGQAADLNSKIRRP